MTQTVRRLANEEGKTSMAVAQAHKDNSWSQLQNQTHEEIAEEPVVVIVDDDPVVREGLCELFLSAGFETACYASIAELLEGDVLDRHGCLILDVRMPGASGLDLQLHLIETGRQKPIIFLTGYGDIPMSVQAMKAGAIDFLTKPAREQTLLDAVSKAISLDRVQRAERCVVNRNLALFESLTARERQVFREVACGHLNKQIAFLLEISEVTVKLHRANVMRKMNVTSIGCLIQAWETLPRAIREAYEVSTGAHRFRGLSEAG